MPDIVDAKEESDESGGYVFPQRLYAILCHARPHMSATELEMVAEFIREYEPEAIRTDRKIGNASVTEVMAWKIVVPLPDGSTPTTLFSCHTDTVHAKGGMQVVRIRRTKLTSCEFYKTDKEPLGADDGAGIWVMLEMIDAKVPGVYVFHRGEERGGIGSSAIAREYPDFLSGFKRAVAFDRRGTSDVITHQRGGRCCSDTFATALADALNEASDSLLYLPSNSGLFTDTANYIRHIPECTNLSVGYACEHSGNETLDVAHVMELAKACIKVDWEALPAERDPKEVPKYEPRSWATGSHHSSWPRGNRYDDLFDDDDDRWSGIGVRMPQNLEDVSEQQMRRLASAFPIAFASLVAKEIAYYKMMLAFAKGGKQKQRPRKTGKSRLNVVESTQADDKFDAPHQQELT